MKTYVMIMIFAAVIPVAVVRAAPAGTNSITGGLYKTFINESLGQFAVVDSTREVVNLYDKSNHAIWTTNVVMGLRTAPVLSERRIHGLVVYKGDLWVKVGRGYGILDIKTGNLKGFAQN